MNNATAEMKLKGVRVLLVEDDEINQFLAISILEGRDAEVETAENGLLAIEKLRTRQYDIVLMDMQMPEMGGLEATELIRKELQCTTPIIALTANAFVGDEEKCLAAGMNDYVSKPFTLPNLMGVIIRNLKPIEIS